MAERRTDRGILFADVEGSVRLFRRLSDPVAHDAVEACLGEIRSAVDEAGGQVVKSIGDGVMAVFDDLPAACDAAIAAQRRLSARLSGRPAPDGEATRIRIGIHAGPVIADAGDFFGDTVNIASRLAGVASGGEIIMAMDLASRLSSVQRRMVRRLGAIAIKGVTPPRAIAELLWDANPDSTVTVVTDRLGGPGPGGRRLGLAYADRRWTLRDGGERISIGRSDGNTIVIAEPRASRDHATIEFRGDLWVLIDHSTNGTSVAFADEPAIMLKRQELILHGLGAIGAGFDPALDPAAAIRFTVLST
ncbi:MAG: adenylate/guanylate cyclase domain-containing protein [Rhizobiales bacterium]|nr:adenylate/guanylate cyclase domain-containing protein [Hyphomicrobiales bacterium]